MSKIITLHSFRGGTGKSNITANLAYLLFSQGYRVAIIDGDLASPGIHIIFGIETEQIKYTLNDYLNKRCSIKQAAIEVSEKVENDSKKSSLFVISSSLSATEIAKILRTGYSIELLLEGVYKIIEDLELDYLLIDTHPGIKEETLLLTSVSDVLLVVLRPDNQDYQGTAVSLEIAEKLEIPRRYMILNKVLEAMNPQLLKETFEDVFKTPIVGILNYCEEMTMLGSSDLFVKKYKDHPNTETLNQIIDKIR